MINRATKLRFRRRFRRTKRHVEDMGVHAEERLEKHFFKRLERLVAVRRFVASWMLFIILLVAGLIYQTRSLSSYYLSLQPAPGGAFTEGIVGSFTDANPLYATSAVDSSVARLVFASLLKYNQSNELVGDMAEAITADERGVRYTVVLKQGLKWHDGKPLTAYDVVFTYNVIQNPDAKSHLASSWQRIKVEAADSRTVIFTLPNPLSSFPHSLTNGIVPKHLLEGIPTSNLRSITFNTTHPVGSGPFRWEAIEVLGDTSDNREERIALAPYDDYHGGKPKLNKLIIRTFKNKEKITNSFKNQELNGMAGLEFLPQEIESEPNVKGHDIVQMGQVMVFLKSGHPLLGDVNIRRALLLATDKTKIMQKLGYPFIATDGPLLKDQLGYNRGIVQRKHNLEEAKQILEKEGWVMGQDGVRTKNNTTLSFGLYSGNNEEYTKVSETLKELWSEIGVKAEPVLQNATELQATTSSHGYDALLYGIALGPDPDVFAFWHSTQADILSVNFLNFSEFKSSPADRALEAGRTRGDAALRAAKYSPFLEAWVNDVPAIALYQPRFLYVTRGELFGFTPHRLNNGPDRYSNVENWMIREERILK